MKELIIENSIEIVAPATAVWDALVNPEMTKQYMFGCITISDWKVGSELLWQGHYEGKDIVFVKGFIIEIDAPNKLVYSTFDPNSAMENIPQNYLNVTYQLSENEGKTKLEVIQGDFSKVADGEKRYLESTNNGEGWNPILVEIKKLVEGEL
jgi:uncharacterized protein YndB with AHSA1/START domain